LYLKRLEIQGFKSLADKMVLEFNPGISAIVGPNGSGKSNIADAVRWVLGEQSVKSLRGAKMEDVIFSGSDKRKPVGMAEVSITLDNSAYIFPLDYSEITVSRRVYRSGESEFLINKTPCRLRDIQELFMDTGIGREGYSIIGQGKIDEILSTKSEDRRQIIEEAAGIVKYKNRKTQAVKKLAETEQNMIRISDIIGELEAQIGPLQSQSEKARQYLSYKNELIDLEVNLLVNQAEEQKSKLAELNNKDEQLKLALIQAETKIRSLESDIESRKLAAGKLDEELARLQKDLYDTGSLVEKKEAEARLARERLKDIDVQKGSLADEIAELREREKLEKNQYRGDEESLVNLRGKISSGEKRLAEAEEKLNRIEAAVSERRVKIEELKSDVIDLLNQTAGVKNSINSGEIEMQALLRRVGQLEEQKTAMAGELQNSLRKEKEIKNNADHVARSIEALSGSEDTLANKVVLLNEQLKELQDKLVLARESLQEKTSRLKVLEELQNEYEGYYRGVKEVLMESKNEQKCGNICGVMAELIKVPPMYETAVEVALGSALQFIVTETDEDARKSISYLKKNKAGRATFLPLNTIQPAARRRDIKDFREIPKIIGLASDVVECDPKYSNVVEYLLGNVLIVNELKYAVEAARVTNYSVRVVTLEGDMVNPGGSMTGGAYQRARSSLLGRVREIEENKAGIKTLQEEVSALESAVAVSREELDSNSAQLAGIRTQLNELFLARNSLEKDAEMIIQEKDRIETAQRLLEEEIINLTRAIGDNKSRIADQKVRLAELLQKDECIRNNIDEMQLQVSELEKERFNWAETVTRIKVELAALCQEEINYAHIINKVSETIKDLGLQVARKESQIRELDVQGETLKAGAARHEQEIHELNKERCRLEDSLNRLRNERMAAATSIGDKENEIKSLSKELALIKEQLHASDVRKARLEFEVENALAKLSEEFQLSYEEALLRKTEIRNKREVFARVKELKESIIALGSVNVGAIDEFERIKERYGFLNRQFADLQQAKESLYKVIEEMDQIMNRRFGETFADINKNFGEVFSRVFGGGKAELILNDADNLLESGIDILAQPPGKKTQHLSLLSGGERALTAISLLFAILKTKPSPFCVLDEIEASLDEANIDRFAGYLKEFAGDTQFIVITHRKGTMEAADVLYGVTMDDSGVSKLVSMKLSEAVSKVS